MRPCLQAMVAAKAAMQVASLGLAQSHYGQGGHQWRQEGEIFPLVCRGVSLECHPKDREALDGLGFLVCQAECHGQHEHRDHAVVVHLLAGLEGQEPLAADPDRCVVELLGLAPQVEGKQAAKPLGAHRQAAVAVRLVVAHAALAHVETCQKVLAA